MLNINPETVCFIIAKAREFQAKEEVVIPEAPLSPADTGNGWTADTFTSRRSGSWRRGASPTSS